MACSIFPVLSQFSRTELVLEGPDKDVFSVQPQYAMSDSIVQLLVKNSQLLDYEKTQQMILQVRSNKIWLKVLRMSVKVNELFLCFGVGGCHRSRGNQLQVHCYSYD